MEKINELRQKPKNEIQKALQDDREKLRQLRFDLAAGKVKNVREIQKQRFAGAKVKIRLNSEMSSKQVDDLVNFAADAENFLKNILEKSFVSARGYYRIIKIAQTIADLEESEKISANHLAEAFQYRLREKTSSGF